MSIVIIVSSLLGLALGIGTSWARLGRAPDFSADYDVLASVSHQPDTPRPASGPQPRAKVDAEDHDFGTVEREHYATHTFRITNVGKGPLELKTGGTTCMKCTVSKIPKAPILPGETAGVEVQYHATIDAPQFRQSATILTNDPLSPRLVFTVTGKISASYSISPPELVFSKLTATASTTAKTRVVSYLVDTFSLKVADLADADTAPFFDVQIVPIPAAELTEPEAKAGYNVLVSVKPGLPLGPVRQKVVFETDLPGATKLELPVTGAVYSDITISGPGWDRDAGVLQLGVVNSRAGIRRTVTVLVHGEHRHDVEITVGKRSPDFLAASLGEATDLNNGSVVRIPLTVEIPPGSPPANFLGSPGKMGQIILDTTHPGAKQIRLYVQFAVEN